ncbi:glycosyltransferase [Rosistilla oblonga]|uniref:glycosyltransferase n=1 Tax=Rosistilla oblonga TaxID=2527990 RepID=UPI003A96B8D6
MRFLFVVSGRDVPSTRFRILPYLPLLESAGHRCDVAYSFPQKYDHFRAIGWRLSQRLKRTVRHWHCLLASRRNYDAIVIEREVFDDDSSDIEAKLRKATQRLVLDLDDGVFLRHEAKFDRVAKMCDVAIAGNRWLADYLASRTPQIEQIPTCVRLADYPLRPATAQRATTPQIGWIGTTHNVPFLQEAAPALRTVARTIPLQLVVVAPSDERLGEVDLAGVDVRFRKWDPRTEVEMIRDMDIGIMPLSSEEPWMKYKCGLKLIQYLAVGIPGIAAPVGVNDEIMAGNAVGRAASNDAQWQAALEELIGDIQLRQQLGTAGRALVEQKYSIEGNWRRLEAILTGAPAQ